MPSPPRGVVPPVLELPKGPFDPKDAQPWDDYIYPDTPSVVVPEAYEADKYRAEKLREWIDEGMPRPERPKLPGRKPAPPERRLPGAPVPPERRLPASFGPGRHVAKLPQPSPLIQSWKDAGMVPRDFFENAEVLGLFGPTPLELYNQYLEAAGIRYFSAWEITEHRWRHANKRLAPGRSSAWHFMYDLFEPEFAPKGFHFLLVKHVVPPPELWPQIIPVLRVLDRFRHWLGKPVRAISGYRHPWYNRQIKGSSTSYHMQNGAVDFTYSDRFEGYLDHDLFLGFFDQLYRQKGDGTGRYHSFIHVDIGWDRHLVPGKAERWVRPKGWKPPSRR